MVVSNDDFFSDVLSILEMEPAIPVKGYSMLPFIRGGKDLVVLEPLRREPAVDDIVLFYVGPKDTGRYVMHRIVGIDGDRVDIMGDGVPRNHEHVTKRCLLARAKTILRNGDGKVNSFNYSVLPSGVRSVDPYSPGELRKVHFWQWLGPFRRYLLFIYKRLPWNRAWVRTNSKNYRDKEKETI